MTDAQRRRELRDDHRERRRVAAVYLLRIGEEAASLATTTDLEALRNRLAFAKATGTSGALDLRHRDAIRRRGMEAVRLEVLDTLDVEPTMTPAELASDLNTLETLWRERLGGIVTA